MSSDQDSVEQLAVLFGDDLVRLAFLVSGDRELALDAAQAVFLHLIARTGTPTVVRDWGAYLRRAVINEVRSSQRRSSRRRTQPLHLTDVEQPQDFSQETVDLLQLQDALQELSHQQRTAIVMRYYLGSSDDEISSALACARSTVRVLIFRGIRKLRLSLEGSEHE